MLSASRSLPATVYKITNLLNGKFYIGVTTKSLRRRLTQHFAAATQRKKIINGAFSRAIRKWGAAAFVIEPIVECGSAELALEEEIRLIAELKPHYNSTSGGDGSAGHHKSAEARAKIGAVSRGNTHRQGKTHSAETVEILRQHGLSRKDLFASFSHLGPKASARPVECVNDYRRFESASAAARHYGVSKSAVIELCQGKNGRKTVGGRKFCYVEDA